MTSLACWWGYGLSYEIVYYQQVMEKRGTTVGLASVNQRFLLLICGWGGVLGFFGVWEEDS